MDTMREHKDGKLHEAREPDDKYDLKLRAYAFPAHKSRPGDTRPLTASSTRYYAGFKGTMCFYTRLLLHTVFLYFFSLHYFQYIPAVRTYFSY